ncbi:MAG: hypothetical protein EOP64_00300 [Sphingomonas sp.]|nr:MAG: hypothetical protein EOP64_00300 [Sphingomonas sp.]
MAVIKLPLDQALPWYNFSIVLSGTRYGIEVRYNTRDARWRLSLYDAGGAAILLGLPMLTGRSITDQYRTYPVPPGVLAVIDTTGNDTPATLGSFLTTHALVYAEPGT